MDLRLLLTAVLCLCQEVFCKDYYQVLGLSRDATERDVKKAFRRLALQYHPDKNKDANAEEMFRSIAEAYEVLSDPDQRRQYDMGGGHGYGGHHFKGSRARDFHFNFDDLFKQFEDDIFGDMNADMRSHYAAHFDNHFSRHAQAVPGFDFEDLFNAQGADVFGFGDSFFGNNIPHPSNKQASQRCKTVTQKVGSMVTTYTQCS